MRPILGAICDFARDHNTPSRYRYHPTPRSLQSVVLHRISVRPTPAAADDETAFPVFQVAGHVAPGICPCPVRLSTPKGVVGGRRACPESRGTWVTIHGEL